MQNAKIYHTLDDIRAMVEQLNPVLPFEAGAILDFYSERTLNAAEQVQVLQKEKPSHKEDLTARKTYKLIEELAQITKVVCLLYHIGFFGTDDMHKFNMAHAATWDVYNKFKEFDQILCP